MKPLLLVCALAAGTAAVVSASGEPRAGSTIRVPEDAPGLFQAIAGAEPGDTIVLGRGTYRGGAVGAPPMGPGGAAVGAVGAPGPKAGGLPPRPARGGGKGAGIRRNSCGKGGPPPQERATIVRNVVSGSGRLRVPIKTPLAGF